jgi:hypothetical protein
MKRSASSSSAEGPERARPARPSAEPPPLPEGALRLSTTLLSDLVVPDGAARATELRELSWKRWSGYHRRSLAENAMSRLR